MTNRRFHTQHSGEIDLQQKRHTPGELASKIPHLIETEMPAQHAEFFAGLSYLPLGTLDKNGRPWASILVTASAIDQSVGISISAQSELKLTARVGIDDPFYRALAETKIVEPNVKALFAGVGVEFSNRRRNKLAGVIKDVQRQDSGHLNLTLKSDEHLGNCPKYITIRTLVPERRSAETIVDSYGRLDTPLPKSCIDHIDRVSTVFLATKHCLEESNSGEDQADMGFNHRGGAPGFVRLYEQADPTVSRSHDTNESRIAVTTYLVLPDFTGNRFYQSLGNIQSDKLVGLALPDFHTGSVLYVTGEAENLFDDDAQRLMPRMSLVTRIRITGAVFIKEAMDLKLVSDEQLSPYNPPIRYLSEELENMGHSSDSNKNDVNVKATLISAKEVTPSVCTFSFKLSATIQSPLPGGFCVFDFSDLLNQGYNHMDEINPQLVNEDYLRTWTISSAPKFNLKTLQFDPIDSLDITVKLKSDGLISPFLHAQGKLLSKEKRKEIDVGFNGVGGGFSCFQKADDDVFQIPPNMLWVAGGVGITPFMSMWDGILELSKHTAELSTNIVLLFAGRGHDFELVRHFLNTQQSLAPSISITIMAFLSTTSDQGQIRTKTELSKQELNQTSIRVYQRRFNAQDIGEIEGLIDREVFLCGSESLTGSAREWLQEHGVDALKIHHESFYF